MCGPFLFAIVEESKLGQYAPTLYAVDASNPAAPAIAATVALPGAWEGYGGSLSLDTGNELRGYSYSYQATTFWTLDVSDGAAPTVTNQIAFEGLLSGYVRSSLSFAADSAATPFEVP